MVVPGREPVVPVLPLPPVDPLPLPPDEPLLEPLDDPLDPFDEPLLEPFDEPLLDPLLEPLLDPFEEPLLDEPLERPGPGREVLTGGGQRGCSEAARRARPGRRPRRPTPLPAQLAG